MLCMHNHVPIIVMHMTKAAFARTLVVCVHLLDPCQQQHPQAGLGQLCLQGLAVTHSLEGGTHTAVQQQHVHRWVEQSEVGC